MSNDRVFQLKKIFKSNIDQFIKYYNFDVISDIDESSEEDSSSEVESL